MNTFLSRSLFVTALLISILFLPWWVVFIVAAIGCFWFDRFFEIIILGVVYDIWFHIPGISWYHAAWHTILAIAIYLGVFAILKVVRRPVFRL